MKYKAEKKDNGKYRILGVPIFKLGNTRGNEYNYAWGMRLLDVMQSRARNGYRPPLIIGHNEYLGLREEGQAVGFLGNFRIEDAPGDDPDGLVGTVVCDLDDVLAEVFELIQDLRYPSRSVEVHFETAEISALALLGSNEPYFKFPQLQVEGFSAGSGAEAFIWTDEEGLMAKWWKEMKRFFGGDGDKNRLKPVERPAEASGTGAEASGTEGGGTDAGTDGVDKYNENGGTATAGTDAGTDGVDKYNENGGTATAGTDKKTRVEDRDMTPEQFKEKYGCTPEEMAARASDADKYKAEAAELRSQQRKAKLEEFGKFCQDQRVTPANIDVFKAQLEKADDLESSIGVFKQLVTDAASGKLCVPMDESGRHAERNVVPDASDPVELDKAIRAYAADKGVSYAEAEAAVYKLIDAEKREGK